MRYYIFFLFPIIIFRLISLSSFKRLAQETAFKANTQQVERNFYNFTPKKYINISKNPIFSLSLETDNNSFALMKEESLGQLRINLEASQVVQVIGNPPQKGENVYWAADGLYHQDWYYPEQGITLGMSSVEVEGEQKIASIQLTSPSQLQTQRGIRIGSSFEQVYNAYQQEQDRENSIPGQLFVAGSIYGGLIFTFENNNVTKIFLGSGAE